VSIAVSIVEDDAGVRSSLVKLINSSPGYRCVSHHSSAENALDEIPKLKPDVALMDINLLTVYQNTDHIFKALAAGATGYLLKQTPPAELLAAIRDVNAGGSPMSGHIARKIVQSFQDTSSAAARAESDSLSPREAEVLDLLAKGFLYKEIADHMKISYATVHTHIRHVYEKLHVRSRTEAVAKHLGQGRARHDAINS
jgi:DNA-binding NarL/FixJ family response regulator